MLRGADALFGALPSGAAPDAAYPGNRAVGLTQQPTLKKPPSLAPASEARLTSSPPIDSLFKSWCDNRRTNCMLHQPLHCQRLLQLFWKPGCRSTGKVLLHVSNDALPSACSCAQGQVVMSGLVLQLLRELDAAMGAKDVERLEEAIQKSAAWAKRAPINTPATQVSTAP